MESAIETPANNQFVNLTPQNITVSAYVKDVVSGSDGANNTAYNVSLNLSLPSVLLNRLQNGYTADNLSYFNETVNDTTKYSISPVIEFTAANLASLTSLTMTNGLATLTITSVAKGYENSIGSLSLIRTSTNQTEFNSTVNIILSCLATEDGVYVPVCWTLDGDYVAPAAETPSSDSGGGGGGAGGGTFDKSSAVYSLVRGEKQEFEFVLENKLDLPKKDIKVTIKGNNSQYVSVYPASIDYLGPHSNKTIIVKITAPSYFNSGKFLLEFTFKGLVEGNATTPFTETKYITLEILEMSKESAQVLLNNSLDILSKMNSSGLYLKEVQKLIDTMKDNYDKLSYNNMIDLAKQVNDIYNSATESQKMFSELNLSIIEAEKNGITVVETKKLMYLAKILFERGDYVGALAKLKEAKSSFLLETKGEFSIYYAIKNNPVQSLAILISISLVGLGSGYLIRLGLLKRKVRVLAE